MPQGVYIQAFDWVGLVSNRHARVCQVAGSSGVTFEDRFPEVLIVMKGKGWQFLRLIMVMFGSWK